MRAPPTDRVTHIGFASRLPIFAARSIVSKGVARARPETIDVTPTPAFADTPVWATDPATSLYIKACQGSKPGDPIDPIYVERIGTSSLISDAILEYDDKRYREALAFYRTALKMTGGDQLRVSLRHLSGQLEA